MEYTGVKYNQKKYTTDEEWAADKTTISFDFPNLPYLIDGDKIITESDAINTHICLKSGHKELLGKNDDQIVSLATVKGVLNDARTAVSGAVYNPDFIKVIDSTLKEKVFPKFENLNKFIGSGEGLIGTGLTYVDFVFYELAQLLLAHDEKVLDNYANLKKLAETIANLPQIQAYLASDRFQARPLSGSDYFNPK